MTIRYDEIWGELAAQWGARMSAAVIARHTPAETTTLRDCVDCGLWYFSPSVPGSAEFYAELTGSSPQYYTTDKWEFQCVRELLRPGDRVLDVACGRGAFLESIVGRVRDAVGVDTNPDATALADGKAFQLINSEIGPFARRHRETFDVVCAFQVIEHLDDIMPFVRSAFECVVPGGRLVLSVPNRGRRRVPGSEPLDCPPHHLSRWSEQQLEWIARSLQAEVISVIRQPTTRAESIGHLRLKEMKQWFPGVPGRERLIKATSRLAVMGPATAVWEHFRLHDRLQMWGHSLVVVLRK